MNGDMNETMGEGMHQEKGYASLFVSQDMLPEGMKVKANDVLEFKVVNPDSDGQIEVVYNTGKDEGDDWEKGFMEHMSARSNEQPEVPANEGNY